MITCATPIPTATTPVTPTSIDQPIGFGTRHHGAPIGIDSKRVDDLTNRMDALSNKLITIKPSQPP
jgi:hypothetical protein